MSGPDVEHVRTGDIVEVQAPEIRRIGRRWHWRVSFTVAHPYLGPEGEYRGEHPLVRNGQSRWRWLATLQAHRTWQSLQDRAEKERAERETDWAPLA